MIFVKALGNRIYDSVQKKFLWGIPYVYNGSDWVEAHTYVCKNGSFVKMPNWKPAMTRPMANMTANSSQGCVASASTEYSTSAKAYMAFDGLSTTPYGWFSKTSDTNPWIQLKMDVVMKDIVVTLSNRSRSDYICGIINAKILGSDDGSSWVEIGSITNRNGSTASLTTTHRCNNTDNTYRYVRISISDWDGTSYVAVGNITIDGNVEK